MGDPKQLDIDSLQLLIKAVTNYQEKIVGHYQMIQNAANLCDQAMGSDAISRKQIEKLNEAANELIKTSEKAKQMAEELIADYKSAQEIYDMS